MSRLMGPLRQLQVRIAAWCCVTGTRCWHSTQWPRSGDTGWRGSRGRWRCRRTLMRSSTAGICCTLITMTSLVFVYRWHQLSNLFAQKQTPCRICHLSFIWKDYYFDWGTWVELSYSFWGKHYSNVMQEFPCLGIHFWYIVFGSFHAIFVFCWL